MGREKIREFTVWNDINNLSKEKIFNRLVNSPDVFFPAVFPFEVNWDDERVKSQKSIFLCQCNPSETFKCNLLGFDDDSQEGHEPKEIETFVKKISIPVSFQDEVFKTLDNKCYDRKYLLPDEGKFGQIKAFMNESKKNVIKHRKSMLD